MRPYIFIFFAMLPFFLNAAAMPSIKDFIKQAEVIKANAVISANSVSIKVSTTIKGFAANDPYMVKNIDVPKASFMSHVKGNLKSLTKRNAWYAGWFATVGAAGWAIDELHNQMTHTVKTQYGDCFSPNLPWFGNMTNVPAAQCVARVTSTWPDVEPRPRAGTVNPITYDCFNTGTGSYQYWDCIRFFPKTSKDESQPVPENALYESLVNHMLQEPKKAADAFMVPDAWPYPYPQIFPETVPYIPGVAEADQEALDWYFKGLLQSNNPNAPYYVTPERHQQIAALASQLQQGITPEGDAAALNDKLKKPLTQKELEETLKKEREAEAKADQEAATKAQEALAPAETALDKLNEEKKWFEDAIKDSANQAPPSQGLSLPKWTWPVGSCKPFPITFSISNLSAKANDGGAFCDNYNNVYHPLIYWFLYMLLALYLFVLWNRTMVQVLGSR